MADSRERTVARVDRLEAAFVRLVDVQVAQREHFDGLTARVDGLHAELQNFRESMTERLDRLIALTMQERTHSFERLADIERRLARLEKHSGI